MSKFKIVLITTDNDYFISDESFTEDEAFKKQQRGFTIVQTETVVSAAGVSNLKAADAKKVKKIKEAKEIAAAPV